MKPSIQDLLHIYLSEYFKKRSSPFNLYWKGIFGACTWWLKNVLFLFLKKNISQKESVIDKVWLIVGSKNNHTTLSFIKDAINESVFVTTNTHAGTSLFKNIPRLSFHRGLLYLWQFPFQFIRVFKQHGFYAFKVMDRIAEGTGMFQTCMHILQSGKPKAIVFANDHTVKSRSLILAAKRLKIPIIYIQHASVTDFFPPLVFDLSLLEGQDALDKYQKIGSISGEVKLVGMPKFDGYTAFRNKRTVVERIGICTNTADDLAEIEALMQYLVNALPDCEFCYRPHPKDNRSISLPAGVNVSNAKEEMIFDYLLQQDLIIAGTTSTHLEACMLNVLSIHYASANRLVQEDYYGYVKQGMVPFANDTESLVNMIKAFQKDKPEVWQRANYYNAVINTPNEGKSQALIISEIKRFIFDYK